LESSAKKKASTPLHNSSFAVASSHFSNVGIIFTRILFAKGEKVVTRALMIPFLAIYAKGGESMSPKQKDRTTTKFKIFVFSIGTNFRKSFSIDMIFKLVSHCVQKGERVVFFKINILKPS
jgi:hypothetical protein